MFKSENEIIDIQKDLYEHKNDFIKYDKIKWCSLNRHNEQRNFKVSNMLAASLGMK